MEAKLKQLKVNQLKEILQEAGVAFKERENKSDLILKVLGNSEALRIAGGGAKQAALPPSTTANVDDDLLAPPEDLEWEPSTTTSVPKAAPPTKVDPPAKPVNSAPAPEKGPPAPSASENAAAPPAATEVEDDETARKRQRAARFGVPFVEPKAKGKNAGADDSGKLKARSERFGVTTAAEPKGKRTRSPAPVDADEAEKRRKRAERFGLPVSANAAST